MSEQVSTQDMLAEMAAAKLDIGGVAERKSNQVADGKCVLRIENAYIGRSKNNRLQMTAVCKVVSHEAGNDQIGMTYTKNWGLVNADNIAWLKGDLLNLGIKAPVKNEDLATVPQQLVGLVFACTLVANEGFPPNCYINAGALQSTLSSPGTKAPF
jgi:hypothetical protein